MSMAKKKLSPASPRSFPGTSQAIFRRESTNRNEWVDQQKLIIKKASDDVCISVRYEVKGFFFTVKVKWSFGDHKLTKLFHTKVKDPARIGFVQWSGWIFHRQITPPKISSDISGTSPEKERHSSSFARACSAAKVFLDEMSSSWKVKTSDLGTTDLS